MSNRALGVLALSVMIGLLAFSVGVARAEAPKLVSYGSFGSGQLNDPVGVAVDQTSSDVYVASVSKGGITKFDSSGKLISPPSPFGVGNERFTGAAVNPTNGDVYVASNVFNEVSEAFEGRINSYDPSGGVLLSSFAVAGCVKAEGVMWAQIATDSAGNIYLPCAPQNEVQKFSPTGTPLQTVTGSGESVLKSPTGVAVDASGNVWVADTANNRIEELDPAGTFIREIKSEGVQALALDTHDEVFALVKNSADFCGSFAPPCYHVVEYSSAGAPLADIGAGAIGGPDFIESVFGGFVMLAVNGASGRVYVSDGADKVVWIFGPPSASVIGRELAVEVGASDAKLGAQIIPGGIETTYHFEYGTTAAYGQTVPFPEGDVGTGVTPRTIWATTSGLAPGTTYHYRVVATNELGTVAGADQTFTTETSAQVGCPNEQLRSGFSATLPDCRAYELVTPPTKDSTQPDPYFEFPRENHASREGQRMSYFAIDSLPGSRTDGESYISTRGVSGWIPENIIPLQSYSGFECPIQGTLIQAYSSDLSKGVLSAGKNQRAEDAFGGGCGAPGLVLDEPSGVTNLFLRDNTNGNYQLIDLTPSGVTPADAHFDGASSDFSHIVFDEHAQLTVSAPAGVSDLYEWTGGVVRLVTVLPDGTPVAGSLANNGFAHEHAVSADGSRIIFTAGGKLYVRLKGSSTMQLDAPQASGGGGGHFMDASADGSEVFFTDDASAGLTSDTQPGSGTNLYRYDLNAGQLTDLTPQGHAEVQGVSAASEDGSYLYFVSDANLAARAIQGQPNLYRWHSGTTTFVATISQGLDSCVQAGACARVSPSGAFLAFASKQSLTGYDNTDAKTGVPDTEVFLYDAGSNQLICASCNPSGDSPTGGATMETPSGGTPHYLSDSGRLFFDTPDTLLPSDTNGQTDVYEYESGQLHLISTGTSSTESVLLDASESGNDVFFLTRQKLVPQDTQEEARGIYDARVDGGFPTPSAPPPCTTADSCRSASPPQPSIFGAPSSATFSGAGNLAPPAEAKRNVKPKKKKPTKQTCKRRRNKRKPAGCQSRGRKATAHKEGQ